MTEDMAMIGWHRHIEGSSASQAAAAADGGGKRDRFGFS
jgi:hypothetical protein